MGRAIGAPLPSGSVTFLLTDIQGSTALLARLGAQRFSAVLAEQDRVAREVCARLGGVVFKNDGDGLLIAFQDALPALHAAAQLQGALADADWADAGRPKVRMALHRGEALVDADDYVSMALHQCARLLSLPCGDQTVCTSAALAGLDEEQLDGFVRLLGAFWVRDFPDAVRIYELDDGRGLTFPSLPAPRADLTNVDGHVPELIGRADDLAAVHDALADARLVTVTGPGGVGKTSLAVQVTETLARHGEAAWFVEFAQVEVTDQPGAAIEQRLVAAIARSLGMAVEARSAVLTRLATRAVTLVLDNCEHVVDAASAVVGDLLAACPSARVLATSREPLGLPEEVIIGISPLELPPPDADLAELTDSSAVQLFLARARQANPRFGLDADNAADVVELCRELDGIPLALELAAGSTKYLSPRDMTARLREVGSLPLHVSRRPVARHRNLAALLDWSLASLSSEQLVVFRRLGAFAGPAGAMAVAAVCGDESMSKWDVLDTLTVLVDKNLVVMRDDNGVTRYDLLMTMRRAARQLLDEADEHDAALRAHARWVVERNAQLDVSTGAERHAAETETVAETMLVLDRAERIGLSVADQVELANSHTVRIAIRAPELAMRLTDRLLARDDLTPSQRSHVYAVRVRTWGRGNDPELVEAAIAAARAADEPRDLCICLIARIQGTAGIIDVREKKAEPAPELPEIASLVERCGRPNRLVGVTENTFGLDAAWCGDYEKARTHYQRGLRAAEADEDPFNAGAALFNIGEVDELAGDERSALIFYARAAEVFRSNDFHLQHAASAMAAATLREKHGDYDAAIDWAADAVLAGRRSGSRAILVDALLLSARMSATILDVPVASAYAREALTLDPSGPAGVAARDLLDQLPAAASA